MVYFLVTFCCVFVALGSFLFGYDSGIISSSIAQTDFKQQFANHISDATEGGIVSSFQGGAVLGSLAVSFISDRYGRRVAMFVGAVLAAFGGALQGGCVTIAMLITGRLFAGFAVGLMSATVPVYCSEIAPPRIRGLLAGSQQFMVCVGLMVAQWVGYGCSRTTGPFSWRFPLSLQVLPALILASGSLLVPETPRWLIEHGRSDDGFQVLTRLHSTRHQSNEVLIRTEFNEIRETIDYEHRVAERSWRQLLWRNPTYRHRLLLACGIQAFTQTSGVNIINYYGPRLYQTLGLGITQSQLLIACAATLSILFVCFFLSILDIVPRRKLLIPGLFGLGACLCVEATLARYYDFSDAQSNKNALRAAVSMYFVFSFCFTPLGVISWIYASEVFPTQIRARGTSLSTVTNWGLNLVFAQCGPIGISSLGYRFFYCFVAFNWAAMAIVYFGYPETGGRGRSLEEVEWSLDKRQGLGESVGLSVGTRPPGSASSGGELSTGQDSNAKWEPRRKADL